MIIFLHCGTDNRSATVLNLFVHGCIRYGLPSRVRTDHGGENVKIALFMNLVRGLDRSSHISGQSVHNQRIERLWVDVYKEVIGIFYDMFQEMEDMNEMESTNGLHLAVLHHIFLLDINRRLEEFRQGWNNHRIR